MRKMERRDFLKTASLGAAAATLAGSVAMAKPMELCPNILWIYSDDHAQNAVSAYGSHLAKVAPTPNIDRIANEGMLFKNSFVTNSICGPCRAVIMTGKHSHINGFRTNGDRFDGTQQTFPKILQKNGYQTAIYGKWHLGTDPIGFDDWVVLPGQGNYYNPDFLTAKGKERVEGYVTDIITDKALGWLGNGRDKNKPFMLMLQHKAPHREWEPSPKHFHTFDDVTIPEPDTLFDDYANRGTAAKEQDMTIDKTMRMGADLKVWPKRPLVKGVDEEFGPWNWTYNRMTEAQKKEWNAAYDPKNDAFRKQKLTGKELIKWKYQRYMKDYLRCIRSVDDNVGRVLDYLKESGLDKNTVVFYSSDQSFYLGEHGWFDKRFIYEESLRTPLLAKWPGKIKPGSNCTKLVQNLDMAETFLEIAGAPVPGDMQGKSVLPLLKGEKPNDWRKSIYYHYYEGEGKVHNVYKHYGLRTFTLKLAYFYTLDEWEFYDLKTDPQEMKNQIDNPKYARQIKRLKKELARLRELYKLPKKDA